MDSKNIEINPKEKSDLQRLLNSLREEASNSLELSNQAFHISNNLKQIPEFAKDNDVTEKEPKDIIDMLWIEIWRVRRANSELKQIVDHLQNVIGF